MCRIHLNNKDFLMVRYAPVLRYGCTRNSFVFHIMKGILFDIRMRETDYGFDSIIIHKLERNIIFLLLQMPFIETFKDISWISFSMRTRMPSVGFRSYLATNEHLR